MGGTGEVSGSVPGLQCWSEPNPRASGGRCAGASGLEPYPDLVVRPDSNQHSGAASRHRSAVRWRLVAVLALLLSGCAPAAATSSPPDVTTAGLEAASSAMCEVIRELPDLSAAKRAFTNQAHDALHALAAHPGLARPTSARVLEAMERAEVDFGLGVDQTAQATDLAGLKGAADSALQSLGIDVPTCEP